MGRYDPFRRGPHPAGVRTLHWTDPRRDRTLPVEVWYPAHEAARGRDTDPATQDRYKPLPFAPEVSQAAVRDAEALGGTLPLVAFSHGFGGDRRQTTHLCTHWASHGYAVIAMDHVGNTTADMFQMAVPGASAPAEALEHFAGFMADRPADASFVIDRALAGDAGLGVDAERVGIAGHSFGGWTSLVTSARDRRIRAALPLAPAGGRSPLVPGAGANPLAEALLREWKRPVPTLYLVAELDTLLPLPGMRELIAGTPGPTRAVNLLRADHFHFCDRAEQVHDMFKLMVPMLAGASGPRAPDVQALLGGMKASAELCPGEHAYALLQGLGLAHMDAHLRGSADAAALLAGDLEALLAGRGVAVQVL